MPELKLDKLNSMYENGKSADKELFAEQKTNILLRMGNHYKKHTGRVFEELRSRGIISKEKKIRLTKNHIHKITNTYENAILESSPSVKAVPFNELELQDTKSAQLNQAVIDWVKHTNVWSCKQAKAVHDFINIGEVFSKIRWDESKREFIIERMLGFDMKRNPDARSLDEVKWWIHEQMVEVEEFKKIVEKLNPDELDKVKASNTKTVKMFDAASGNYRDSKKHVMVKELFLKPNEEYPNGQYVMFTDDILVYQEDLPFGIFPIAAAGFDELTTSPRSASIIRVCRPYQVEINRAASKMAEHQITLGDDKVFIQKGTKLTNGGYIHGVRALQVSGKEPIIQAGRSGAQYLEYQISQVNEMYQAANLGFLLEDKQVVGDPYQLLFRAMKDKKKFVKYVEKYERYEIEVFNIVLKLAKFYLEPGDIIRVAGRGEALNIAEFKSMDDTGFEIKVVPQSGDVESQFGKILSITQTLQYAGGQLDPSQIGNLIKHLPFANEGKIFETLTLDSDNAENVMLALDRGEWLDVMPNENHSFMMNALDARMKKADFRILAPEIQQLYDRRMAVHQQIFATMEMQKRQAEMGMIPTGGFLVTVNASWPNPANNNKVERLKIPSDALVWLVSKLQQQGIFNRSVEELPDSVEGNIQQLVLSQPQVANEAESPITTESLV